MEERRLLLRREDNCGERYKQSGSLQFSFEFFGHAFRNTKGSPGGRHSPLLVVTWAPEFVKESRRHTLYSGEAKADPVESPTLSIQPWRAPGRVEGRFY